jgi:WD40 repeat protein
MFFPGTGGVGEMVFSPSGRTFALSLPGRLELIEVATGQVRARLDSGALAPQALSPDGSSLACYDVTTKELVVIDLRTRKARFTIPRAIPAKSSSSDSNTVFSPDGNLLVGAICASDKGAKGVDGLLDGERPELCAFEATTGKKVATIPGPFDRIFSVAISPNGKILATAGGAKEADLRLWDIETRRPLRSLAGHKGPVVSARFSPDGTTLFTAGSDSSVRLWDVSSGTNVHTLTGPQGHCYRVAVSADGKLLASGADKGEIWLWDLLPAPRKKTVFQYKLVVPQANCACVSVEFTPDGKSVVSICMSSNFSSPFSELVVWRVDSGEASPWLVPLAELRPSRADEQKESDVAPLVMHNDPPSRAKLCGLWNDLQGAKAPLAYKAVRTLAAFPRESIPFLSSQLKPVAPVPTERISTWIKQLDSNEFEVREAARDALERLAEVALPGLENALAGKLSPEAKRQIRLIQEANKKFKQPVPPPERLRFIRALEVLEDINNDDARKLVNTLAEGEPAAWLTKEAKTVRERMLKRPMNKP